MSLAHCSCLLFYCFVFIAPVRISNAYECLANGNELLIHAKAGQTYELTSAGYPQATTSDCIVVISVDQQLSLSIHYIHARFSGKIIYTNGDQTKERNCLATAYDAAYDTFAIDSERGLKIHFPVPDNNKQLWMGYKAMIIIARPNDTSCPMGTADDDILVLRNESVIVLPDYDPFSPTRYTEKNCTWKISKPEGGNVLVLRTLGSKFEDDIEQVTISGANGGNATTIAFNKSNPAYFFILKYDSDVLIKYTRGPRATLYENFSFRILVDLEPLTTKTCSLEYNDKFYENNQTFAISEAAPYSLYAKNQICSWKIAVPVNTTFTLYYSGEYYALIADLSGDKFHMEAPYQTQNDYNGVYFTRIWAVPERYNVTLRWESDGLYEYSGIWARAELIRPRESKGTTAIALPIPLALFAVVILGYWL